MNEKYDVNEKEMYKGLTEFMKHSVNAMLNSKSGIELGIAFSKYNTALKLLKYFRIDVEEYEKVIKEFENNIFSENKLEKITQKN